MRVLLKGTCIYSLGAWAYSVIQTWLTPQWAYSDFSRYIPIPLDLVAILAFCVSFASYVGMYNLVDNDIQMS